VSEEIEMALNFLVELAVVPNAPKRGRDAGRHLADAAQ
jgi:hypothetical protein